MCPNRFLGSAVEMRCQESSARWVAFQVREAISLASKLFSSIAIQNYTALATVLQLERYSIAQICRGGGWNDIRLEKWTPKTGPVN